MAHRLIQTIVNASVARRFNRFPYHIIIIVVRCDTPRALTINLSTDLCLAKLLKILFLHVTHVISTRIMRCGLWLLFALQNQNLFCIFRVFPCDTNTTCPAVHRFNRSSTSNAIKWHRLFLQSSRMSRLKYCSVSVDMFAVRYRLLRYYPYGVGCVCSVF